MAAAESRLGTGSLTTLHWVGIVAAVTTAAVHLVLGVQDLFGGFGTLFLISTVGFLAGIAAVVVGYRRRLVYLLGLPFTAGQIVLWFALNQPIPPISTVELVDKLAQMVLVVVLVVLLMSETS